MPIKCYVKPNRTEPYLPRKFHAKDAARVTRYALQYDDRTQVAGEVLDALELRSVMCALLRIIGALDRLEDKLGAAKGISAILTIISGLIKVLKKLPTKRFPWLGVALIALGVLQGALQGLKEVLDELEPVQAAIDVLAPLCEDGKQSNGGGAPK